MEVDTSDLQDSIAHHKRYMKSVRVCISDLERQIRKYEGLADCGGEGYDVDALRESNDHSRGQIDRFNQEIALAQTKIADYRKMIEHVEKKAAISEGIVIDANAYD